MEVRFRANLKEPEVIEHPLLKVYAFICPMQILRNGPWTPMGGIRALSPHTRGFPVSYIHQISYLKFN